MQSNLSHIFAHLIAAIDKYICTCEYFAVTHLKIYEIINGGFKLQVIQIEFENTKLGYVKLNFASQINFGYKGIRELIIIVK